MENTWNCYLTDTFYSEHFVCLTKMSDYGHSFINTIINWHLIFPYFWGIINIVNTIGMFIVLYFFNQQNNSNHDCHQKYYHLAQRTIMNVLRFTGDKVTEYSVHMTVKHRKKTSFCLVFIHPRWCISHRNNDLHLYWRSFLLTKCWHDKIFSWKLPKRNCVSVHINDFWSL